MPHAAEKNRKESSRTVERTPEFRMVHFPDRPLKRAPYAEIPIEEDCKRMLRMLLDWKTGKAKPPTMRSRRTSRDLEKETECMNGIRLEVERREHQEDYENQSLRQPPIMRRRRTSRDLEKETKCMNGLRLEVERREHQENYENQSLRQRRGIQTELTLNTTCCQTAEDGFKSRILAEPQYVSQQTLLPRTTYNPQSMTKASQLLQDASHMSILPPTKYTGPSTQASTVHAQNPTLPPLICPLCRSQSRDSHGDLCSSCKAEFTMSTSSSFYEEDESILHSSTCFPQHSASNPRSEYSSSVYSLDDADDPTFSMSSCSVIGDGSDQVVNTSGRASYQNQNRSATVEKGQPDLYDLDWADYYFDR